jgi:hypothetical protein
MSARASVRGWRTHAWASSLCAIRKIVSTETFLSKGVFGVELAARRGYVGIRTKERFLGDSRESKERHKLFRWEHYESLQLFPGCNTAEHVVRFDRQGRT